MHDLTFDKQFFVINLNSFMMYELPKWEDEAILDRAIGPKFWHNYEIFIDFFNLFWNEKFSLNGRSCVALPSWAWLIFNAGAQHGSH